MLALILISLLYYKGSCHIIPISQPIHNKELIKCVRHIVTDYFAPLKVLTYMGEDDEFLRAIHNLNLVSTLTQLSSHQLFTPNEAYVISEPDYALFIRRFPILIRQSAWNPEARFLIVIKFLEKHQIRHVFDILLKLHVNNVIVVNATSDAYLYAYNPFDNYGCGKRYDEIFSYGKCSQARKQNLYPNKYVTELRNCMITVAIPHWPPYTVFPSIDNEDNDTSFRYSYGIEPHLLQLIGQMEGFTVNVVLDYDKRYSTVSSDMEAAGSLSLLQNNKADVILGGLILVPSRAAAFSYVHDLLPYVDELQFVVKRASNEPPWKNVYLEFNLTVWLLIVLALVFYSSLMIILLRAEDRSLVVLKLLENLLLHGCRIQCQTTVKAIFVIWVWFAYLINAFYQSSLVSLTMHPAKENQISTEADILRHKLKPCLDDQIDNYYRESIQSDIATGSGPGCHGDDESIFKVMNSDKYYTIFLLGILQYRSQNFVDSYGNSLIYTLDSPFSKVIYCMYFYKGFPLLHDIRLAAMRLREIGLVDKAVSDMTYMKTIEHHYRAKKYESRFAIPWLVYVTGCIIAAVTLVVENLSIHII